MAAIFQTIFSNVFSCIKMFEFRLEFHQSLFLMFQMTINHHWFRKWLGADQATSHYLNQWWLIYWCLTWPQCVNLLRSEDDCILTHWGPVTHICVSKLTTTGSDNGLLPGRHQAIIWINAGILSIGPLGTNFSEILIAIETFSFKKMHLKISSVKWLPFCLGLNVLKHHGTDDMDPLPCIQT